MQEPQAFGQNLRNEEVDTGRVAARMRKAIDKTQGDEIGATAMTIGIVFEIAYVEASLPALERGLS